MFWETYPMYFEDMHYFLQYVIVFFGGYVLCFCKKRVAKLYNYSSSLSLNNLETSSKNALRLE